MYSCKRAGSSDNCSVIWTEKATVLIDCGCSAKYITENLGALGIVPKNLTATVITHVHTDHVRARQDLVFCVKITSLFISFPHEDAFEDAFRKYGQEIEECIIHTFVRKF